MPLIVVPAGLGAGLGDGFGLALEELDGGGVTVEDPGAAEELVEPAGAEFDAVAGPATVLPAGIEAVPPHPAIATESVPKRAALNTKRGTERISQF